MMVMLEIEDALASTAVTVALPVTTDCGSGGGICTEDGRMLSNRVD